MPKLLTSRQKKAEILYRNMILLQGRQTATEMALQIGAKSANTWRARLSAPLTLTVYELVLLCGHYGVTPSEMIEKDLLKG